MKFSSSDTWVAVGRIRRPHGVGGDVVVEVLTDFPGRFSSGSLLYLQNPEGPPTATRVLASRRNKQFFIVRLEGVESRTDAERIRSRELFVPERDLHKLPAKHYYSFHLVGCQVFNRSAEPIGSVTAVVETGAGALLQVEGARGEILIPMVEGIVLDVDVVSGRILVDLPEGLVELSH